GDGGVFGFTRAVRDDGFPAGLVGHGDGFDGFGGGADLVEFNEDGVGGLFLNALLQEFGVGNEDVVAHELLGLAELFGLRDPALPVVFGETVFDGDNRVLGGQIG